LLSDSRLAFVDKALIATIAPDRDLGLRVAIEAPRPEPRRRREIRLPGVRFVGGVFNGEGRNQVDNGNQRYLWAGRLEVTALGKELQLAESAFGGRFVTISGSAGTNHTDDAGLRDATKYLGVDIAGAYRGLSGTFEYLRVKHVQAQAGAKLRFKANGFTAQANYLLPLQLPPYKQARLEFGARLEEVDRNDTVPIMVAGEPEQSVRAVTAVASYYLRMHSLKAQLAFTHFRELEDRTAAGADARFDNDQLLLQLTYRLE
jgi:hypothetical protein